ncbi:hypothetical protein FEM48_Zijuj07G0151600 [Ziziphus jujuba var. spinosa]|uniref:Uncharacterized protein n=1 Tax=Ziziphus jujuba var. spinosa TaxID=714518 RepID=A0A978V5C7_ZIZJJ|nr:hypothetical protein FEM48_Zijuj07G0151600 [Ziziphus jujuba var. spinosa]
MDDKNEFSGKVPAWIGESLLALRILIMQSNKFNGSIPLSLCELTCLQILDLSQNSIFGNIPRCLNKLTSMYFGSYEFHDADADGLVYFFTNPALCGPPLTENCPIEATSSQTRHGDEFKRWFNVGMEMGFFIGFWGIFGSLCLNRTWRHASFLFLYEVKDWVLLRLALHTARLQMMFKRNNQ